MVHRMFLAWKANISRWTFAAWMTLGPLLLVMPLSASTYAADADALSQDFRAYLETKANRLMTGERLFRESSATKLDYTMGVVDADAYRAEGQAGYCAPSGATAAQMSDVVTKYLAGNPELRHLPAAHLIRQAFRQAWSCETTQ